MHHVIVMDKKEYKNWTRAWNHYTALCFPHSQWKKQKYFRKIYYMAVLKYIVMYKSKWWGSKLIVSVAFTGFGIWLKGLWKLKFLQCSGFFKLFPEFLKHKQERTPIIFSSCCKYYVCDTGSKTGATGMSCIGTCILWKKSPAESWIFLSATHCFFPHASLLILGQGIAQLTSIPEKWTHVQDQWNGGIPLTVHVTEPIL